MEYTVTFFTQSGAFKFQRFMKENGIEVTLMPVPRKLSSSCGIAAKFVFSEDISSFILEDIDKIYTQEGAGYKTIYSE